MRVYAPGVLSLAERPYDRNVQASDLLGAILRFQVVAPTQFGVGRDLDVENSRVESGLPMECQARDGEILEFPKPTHLCRTKCCATSALERAHAESARIDAKCTPVVQRPPRVKSVTS